MSDDDPGPLARAVKARRLELGYTQADLEDYGGPGVVTVREIEKGRVRHPRELTLAGLDKALLWKINSAARVARFGHEGEEPIPLPDWQDSLRKRQDWLLSTRGKASVTSENPESEAEVDRRPVGSEGDGREPYLTRRRPEDPDLTNVSTDALLEEIARRARDRNPDAGR